ncbi:MAG: hypothetical protein J7J68_08145 [Thermotogaceae bacterium]|nr:hypothetical protein [Thermotogaceae bacterium]
MISFVAYLDSKALKISHNIAVPATMTDASHFYELSVAMVMSLFSSSFPVVLATIVGVLIEVPVMLTPIKIVNSTSCWFITSS